MRKLDIMQEGGYPFDDVTIAYLQQMHDDRDSFLHTVFGDYKIVKGVILNVQTNIYSDGLITVDGKMFHFVGGAPNAKISKKVHDEVANDVYHVMTKLETNASVKEDVLEYLEGIYNRTRDISKENSTIDVDEDFG